MSAPAGHRILPHTADMALEAWAPDKAACIAEAVEALVGSFADVRDAIPRESVTLRFDAADDRGLLVQVLDEVIFQEEVHGRLPADTSVTVRAGSQAEVRFAAVPVGEVEAGGAVPKGVSRHDLRFGPASDGQWRCHVIIDI